MMNRKTLGLAVAATLGLGVGSAHALPLSDYNAADTMDLYMSGASAQDNALRTLFTQLCDRGTGAGSATDTFNAYNGVSGTNQSMVFCRTKGVTGVANGTKILFHKSSVGGSGNGVQPVANSTILLFMTTASTCPAVTPGSTVTCTANALTPASGVGSVPPDGGISDVEPKLLGATPAEVLKLNVQSQNAVPFGLPVTVGLRNALQEAQCLTVGAEDEANMPSLTKAQLAAIYAGNLTDWSSIVDEEGHPLTTARDTCANGSSRTAPVNSNVYVARRVNSSGTQASYEVYFLNARCTTSASVMAPANDGGVCGNGTVNEGSGTSNVKACLNTHNTANRWAVGIFSLENVSNLGTDAWRHIKVDGYAGTALNIEETRYTFWMEQSLQWRNAASGNALVDGAAGFQKKLSMMQAIASNAGQPDTTLCFTHGGGVGYKSCVMALVTNGFVPTDPVAGTRRTAAQVESNPVLTSSKSLGGSTDNCSVPQAVFPTHATFESDNGTGNTPAH
jgi:hypothetical protein